MYNNATTTLQWIKRNTSTAAEAPILQINLPFLLVKMGYSFLELCSDIDVRPSISFSLSVGLEYSYMHRPEHLGARSFRDFLGF